MRLDHYMHPVPDPRIDEVLERLDRIESGLAEAIRLTRRTNRTGEQIMADLSALESEVETNTDVTESVKVLVNRLADELEAANGDQEQIDALVAQLRGNDQGLADLVTANTPASPGDGGGTDPNPPEGGSAEGDGGEPFDPNVPRPA